MINKENNLRACICFIIVLAFAYLGYICSCKFIDIVTNSYKHPVEEQNNIDSLKQVNKTIIIEVEHLDSIKNEKVIKVKELDNDSTLKLFYELLGK